MYHLSIYLDDGKGRNSINTTFFSLEMRTMIYHMLYVDNRRSGYLWFVHEISNLCITYSFD